LGAAAAHYYAFLIAAPLGAAAAWTFWRKRRLDLWTTLGCLCAGCGALIAFAPMVFGSDPAHSLVYLGSATTNKAMLLLRESPPLRIEPLEPFLRGQRRALLVYHSPPSLLKKYFSDYPEYAPRLHVLEEGETDAVYRLDPAAPPDATSGGER
jgi:hypothetical protein